MCNAFWRHALFVRGQSFSVKTFDRSRNGCQVIRLEVGNDFRACAPSPLTFFLLMRCFFLCPLLRSACYAGYLRNCFGCRRRNASAGEQRMANVPLECLIPDQPPFTFVGIDYFGPVLVKQKRSCVKRYGCIFTCLTTRVVHIEIAHFLDTDLFISAMRRVIARRGSPQVVCSDNGTNFHGGERELRAAFDGWNQHRIVKYTSQQEIEWIFNPPAAAHMAGGWERLVGSVKKILSYV